MPKLRAEIYVSEDADWQEIEDAKLKAEWKRITTKEERMAKTDLTDKCGSCTAFCHKEVFDGKTAYGRCKVKDTLRERSQKACKTFYHDRNEFFKMNTEKEGTNEK